MLLLQMTLGFPLLWTGRISGFPCFPEVSNSTSSMQRSISDTGDESKEEQWHPEAQLIEFEALRRSLTPLDETLTDSLYVLC